MIETAEIDVNLKEEEFYTRPFKFSYSSLNRLLMAPSIFYKEYVLGIKEIKTEKRLLYGTLIHFLLLDSSGFDDKFMLMPDSLPSDNSMKVANQVFKLYKEQVELDPSKADWELCDFEDEILKILEEINLHQSVGEDKRAAKIIEPKTETYFNYLKNKGRKEIIDSGMLDRCSLAVEVLKQNQQVRDLLGMDVEADGVKFGVYNELDLDMDLGDLPFGLKGVLDNMTVDVENKLVRINDFKTTGKSLVDFPDSVEYWNYWLQAAIYMTLAMEFLKEVINDEWKFEFRFIVFDIHDQVYAYQVSNETLVNWLMRMHQTFGDAKYHYESRNYTLPYKFIAGEVTL